MSICENCKKNPSNLSAIIQGVYYADLCYDCKTDLTANISAVSSGHARWSRSVDLEDHEHEIQQPYNKDGTPNTRFMKLYPEQAKALFSEEDMRNANR